MSKSSELRKLTQEHKKAQQVNADVADYFMQELTRRLQEGEINGGQFVADAIAANRLSRDAAVKLAAEYVREARKLTAPKLLDLRPVEPKFDVLQSTVRASATVRAEEIRAKVRAEVDRRVAEQRAWRAELEAHVTPREKEILEKQKERIRKTAGRWNKADVAKAGRQVVIRSAESAGSGWRVVTDGRPCAFCAMLASYGEDVKGAEHWSNHYFHPGCGCTIQEVPLGTEVEYTEQEKKLIALREEAENHGTTKGEITAYMREHGQGIVKDATVPEQELKQRGRPQGSKDKQPRKRSTVASASSKVFQDWMQHSLDGISDQERKAIETWTTRTYKDLQKRLIEGTKLSKRQKDIVRNLDAILSRNPLPVTVELHRRDSLERFGISSVEEARGLVGKKLDSPGYIAVSTKRRGVPTSKESIVRVHLTAPKGTEAAYIARASVKPEQKETLIIRGKTEVIRKVEVDEQGNLHVYAEVV